MTTEDLYRIFGRYEKIVDAFIPFHPRLRISKGYGFIRFIYETNARAALDILDSKRVDGRIITVQRAKSHHQSVSESHPNQQNCRLATTIPITLNNRDDRKYAVVVRGTTQTRSLDVRTDAPTNSQHNAVNSLWFARVTNEISTPANPTIPAIHQQLDLNSGGLGVCKMPHPTSL
ncbi:uncharacterized protein LOC131250684 [Magnolia sinica]|uniref:uncharacterized protein LOC131250684 n=1 Tax=Magnolia sinica TaxID=86752 RepID=UPI002659E00C|nr:uncharacterized protein LOC131250684 [Magnolia sinica]